MERTLVLLLKALNAGGVSAAARLTPDGKVGVWLGDDSRGVVSYAFFEPSDLESAARWLLRHAPSCFPASQFARDSAKISALVHGARSGSRA